jgi:hypothetical protein
MPARSTVASLSRCFGVSPTVIVVWNAMVGPLAGSTSGSPIPYAG